MIISLKQNILIFLVYLVTYRFKTGSLQLQNVQIELSPQALGVELNLKVKDVGLG
jgi:hypothetical protein